MVLQHLWGISKQVLMRSNPASTFFGDYIIYVDESGDHDLKSINPRHPIFVLAFCLFRVSSYVSQVVPSIQSMKFKYFGHDMVVFHERDIRKNLGSFSFLFDRIKRENFMAELTDLVQGSDFEIFACVIDKRSLKDAGQGFDNPYMLALEFGISAISSELTLRNQGHKETYFVFESRGKREDAELEAEFFRILESGKRANSESKIKFLAVDKKVNSTGLQISDMVARPIGLHFLRPGQSNRAIKTIFQKIHGVNDDDARPSGLKIIC